MATTSPDNLFYPTLGDEAGNLPADLAAMQTSVQNALNDRTINQQLNSYRWANATEQGAQTGMAAGDTGYREDNKILYYYDGVKWQLLTTSVPTPFVPAWNNFTLGNGTQSWHYTVASGRCFVSGIVTLGSTSSVGTDPYFIPPLTGSYTNHEALGVAVFTNSGTPFFGEVHYDPPLGTPFARPYRVSTVNISYSAVNSASPFTWGASDSISMNYNYRITP